MSGVGRSLGEARTASVERPAVPGLMLWPPTEMPVGATSLVDFFAWFSSADFSPAFDAIAPLPVVSAGSPSGGAGLPPPVPPQPGLTAAASARASTSSQSLYSRREFGRWLRAWRSVWAL